MSEHNTPERTATCTLLCHACPGTVTLVSTDTHDTVERDTAGIRLDVDRHRKLFSAIGCDTIVAIATETGVSDRQVRRALAGDPVGEVFMAGTITALHRHARKLRKAGLNPPTLDELFTVVPAKAA